MLLGTARHNNSPYSSGEPRPTTGLVTRSKYNSKACLNFVLRNEARGMREPQDPPPPRVLGRETHSIWRRSLNIEGRPGRCAATWLRALRAHVPIGRLALVPLAYSLAPNPALRYAEPNPTKTPPTEESVATNPLISASAQANSGAIRMQGVPNTKVPYRRHEGLGEQ